MSQSVGEIREDVLKKLTQSIPIASQGRPTLLKPLTLKILPAFLDPRSGAWARLQRQKDDVVRCEVSTDLPCVLVGGRPPCAASLWRRQAHSAGGSGTLAAPRLASSWAPAGRAAPGSTALRAGPCSAKKLTRQVAAFSQDVQELLALCTQAALIQANPGASASSAVAQSYCLAHGAFPYSSVNWPGLWDCEKASTLVQLQLVNPIKGCISSITPQSRCMQQSEQAIWAERPVCIQTTACSLSGLK